jgi:hypothetical protein
MHKIFKFLLAILITLSSFSLYGQKSTSSPYSRYGIGDMYRPGIGYTKGMGGTGIGMQLKNQMNLLNPASFAAQDTLTFLFDFGFSYGGTTYAGNGSSFKKSNGEISHLAISFPVTKWWVANLGMTPFTKVGYNMYSKGYRESYISPVKFLYEGSGGLNRYFISSAFAIKNFSVGVNAYYLLGTLEIKNSYEFWHALDKDVTFNTSTTKEYSVSDMYLGFGAQYAFKLSDNIKGVFGMTYDLANKINTTNNTYTYSKYNYSSGATQGFPTDTVVFEEGVNRSMDLPSKFGMGASIVFKNKLTFALDYTQQDWTGKIYPMSNVGNILKKAQTTSFGVQYVPNYGAVRGYLNHVSFRAGGYSSSTYMKFKGENINDYGMSFGLGLPFRNSGSTLNINYELGRRGTLNNGLIRENYQYLYISLTLRDFWFVKSKFD